MSGQRSLVRSILCLLTLMILLLPAVYASEEGVCRALSDFEDSEMTRSIGYGQYYRDSNSAGNTVTLYVDGQCISFPKAVFAHAASTLIFDLGEDSPYDYFSGYMGIDGAQAASAPSLVRFTLSVSNDKSSWETKYVTGEIKARQSEYVQAEITGWRYLRIYIDACGANHNDHSVIGGGRVYSSDYQVQSQDLVREVSYYDGLLAEASPNDILTDEETELTLLKRNLVKSTGYEALNYLLCEDENAEANRAMIGWLFGDLETLRTYFGGGTPYGGSYYKSLMVLSRLYAAYADDLNDDTPLDETGGETRGELYERLMISLSLTHSGKVVNWMDGKEASDAVERYAVLKRMYEADKLDPMFDSLCVEELRWVTNTMMYDCELEWANWYARTRPYSSLYSPHRFITYTFGYNYGNSIYYDPDRYEEWDEKYHLSEFNLPYETGTWLMWHLFEEGSVCGGISKTGANLAASFGVPSGVIGQPGHAAFLVYAQDANGNGYWWIDNNISGWSGSEKSERMPCDWGNASDTWNSYYQVYYIVMAQAALNDYEHYLQAEELVSLAAVKTANSEKEVCLRAALEAMSYHMDAWYQLIDLYLNDPDKTVDEYSALLKELCEDMKGFPLPMYDLSQLLLGKVETLTDSDDAETAEKATVALAAMNIALNAALKYGTTIDNSVPNASASRTLANTLLGNSSFTLAVFSFDDTDDDGVDESGRIVFDESYASVRFRYSIATNEDGSRIWSDYQSAETDGDQPYYQLTQSELEAINYDDDLVILLEGLSDSEENYFVIDILEGKSVSGLVANDLENRFLGTVTNVVYSLDGGSTWATLSNDTEFAGDVEVLLKVQASGTSLDGTVERFTFSDNVMPDTRSYISIRHETVFACSTERTSTPASNAIDGIYTSLWHSNYANNVSTDSERYLVIELDEPRLISGIDYYPRADSSGNGRFLDCSVYVSSDGTNYYRAASVTGWSNNSARKQLTFSPVYGQYVKIVADRAVNNFASAGEILLFEDRSFEGKTLTEVVTVQEPYKTEYILGETLDLDGLLVECCYEDGSRHKIPYTLADADADSGTEAHESVFETAGEVTVTLSYDALPEIPNFSFSVYVSRDEAEFESRLSETCLVVNRRTNLGYPSLAEAVESAASGDRLQLLRSCETDVCIAIGSRDLTLFATDGTLCVGRSADFLDSLFTVGSGGCLRLESITLDGGAIWKGEVDEELGRGTENNGTTAQASLITGLAADSVVRLGAGTTIQNAAINGSGAVWTGGKIYVESGAVIQNCSASAWGGAFYVQKNQGCYISGGSFVGNSAASWGGVVMTLSNSSALTVSGGSFSYNRSCYGGVIFIGGAHETRVQNAAFSYNSADFGGVLCNLVTGRTYVSSCVFESNRAEHNGGCLYDYEEIYSGKLYAANFEVKNSTFTQNHAGGSGGAIYVASGTLTQASLLFEGNSAAVTAPNVYLLGSTPEPDFDVRVDAEHCYAAINYCDEPIRVMIACYDENGRYVSVDLRYFEETTDDTILVESSPDSDRFRLFILDEDLLPLTESVASPDA